MPSLKLILLGDSDISRWPPALYPSFPSVHTPEEDGVVNYGRGGAELADILRQLDEWKTSHENDPANHLFVCCAGENDVGSGRSVDGILETFRSVLDALFPPSYPTSESERHKMIFLGPKFEPWLADDSASRKRYAKLNGGFQRAVRKHHASESIIYVDCLTLFCTEETANAPGAVHGGRAVPDGRYFDPDGLHLSEAGYGVWKRIVEEAIAGDGG